MGYVVLLWHSLRLPYSYFGLSEFEMVTPKSFWSVTLSNLIQSNVYMYFMASLILRTTHFSALKFISQTLDQAENLFKSVCSTSHSSLFGVSHTPLYRPRTALP